MTRLIQHTLAAAALIAIVGACATDKKSDGTDSVSAGTTPLATPTPAAPVTESAPVMTASLGSKLDPNAASREQLMTVPGMNAAAVDALIAGRPYANMIAADKALAAHADAAVRKQVYAQVWKPIDLNTATKAEIMLIPGVGEKMHHEFEEYRPYKDIAQFDRSIGKYVDKTELARLRSYVSIR